jgi:hypothetical protein
MIRPLLLIVTLIFCSIGSISAKQKASPSDRVFINTRIPQHIEEFPRLVAHGLIAQIDKVKSKEGYSHSTIADIQRTLMSMDVEEFQIEAKKRFLSQFNANEIKSLYEWQSSGFGKRIIRLYEFSHTTVGLQQMKTFFSQPTPVDRKRLRLIKKLAIKIKEIEILINLAAQTQTAIQVALNTSINSSASSYKEVYNQVKRIALKNQGVAKNIIYTDFMHTFRLVLKKDLKKLLEFSQSDIGKKFFLVRQKIITESAVKIAKNIVQQLQPDKDIVLNTQLSVITSTIKKVDFEGVFAKGLSAYKNRQYASAFTNFEKIAKQGHPKAQYYLGRMYQNGFHANKDSIKAYAWHSVAGNQGLKVAQKTADDLLSGFSIVETSKAGKVSRDYISNYHSQAAQRQKSKQQSLLEAKASERLRTKNRERAAALKKLSKESSKQKKRRLAKEKKQKIYRQLVIEHYPIPGLIGVIPEILVKPDLKAK